VRHFLLALGVLSFLGAAASPSRGQENASQLDSLMKAYFAAANDQAKSAAIDALCKSGAEAQEIERRLRIGRGFAKDQPTGWQARDNECLDGKTRPFHLYAPTDYSPQNKYPLVVFLHGAVSRADVPPAREMETLRKDFEKDVPPGFLIILPTGSKGATWWDKTGAANVLAQVNYAKRRYNVDPDRIFLWGFSDGGSGAYWMAMNRPTAWAGFIAYSGNLLTASGGPYQIYPANMSNRPVLAANGGRDPSPYYNGWYMKEWIDQLRQGGVSIDWKSFPQAGHDTRYLTDDRPRFDKFVLNTRRATKPSQVAWETSNAETGRCDWLRIDQIKDVGNNADIKDANLLSLTGPPIPAGLFGNIDITFKGSGLRISRVTDDSLEHKAGFQANDVIVKFEGKDVKTPQDLNQIYVDKIFPNKKSGDSLSGEYERGGQTFKFTLQTAKAERQPIYKRDQPTGAIRVRVEGNHIAVNVRNVAKYKLLIDRQHFDLATPIHVLTNGKESFNAIIRPDLRFMLTQSSEDDDPSRVYCGRIEVEVQSGR
jgi:predicted esterase